MHVIMQVCLLKLLLCRQELAIKQLIAQQAYFSQLAADAMAQQSHHQHPQVAGTDSNSNGTNNKYYDSKASRKASDCLRFHIF